MFAQGVGVDGDANEVGQGLNIQRTRMKMEIFGEEDGDWIDDFGDVTKELFEPRFFL